MITITTTPNDIEKALRELFDLAAHGAEEDPDVTRAANLFLSLSETYQHPFNIRDFSFMTPYFMRQSLQPLTFLFSTGSQIETFVAPERMAQLAERWGADRINEIPEAATTEEHDHVRT